MSIYYKYSKIFTRKIFYRFHRILYFISLRGMGLLNSENDKISGEEWVLKNIVKYHSKVIFDVGANIGSYTKMIKKHYPDSQVYSFEPHPKTFKNLTQNIQSEKYVHTINSAIGSKEGNLELYDHKGLEGSEHASLDKNIFEKMYKTEIEVHHVKVETIDSFCRNNQIKIITFLKIDVEGLEMEVLKGAKQMIANGSIECIQFEFNTNNAFTKTSLNDFLQYLEQYTLYRILPDGIINISEEEPLLQELYAFQNILAIRKNN